MFNSDIEVILPSFTTKLYSQSFISNGMYSQNPTFIDFNIAGLKTQDFTETSFLRIIFLFCVHWHIMLENCVSCQCVYILSWHSFKNVVDTLYIHLGDLECNNNLKWIWYFQAEKNWQLKIYVILCFVF